MFESSRHSEVILKFQNRLRQSLSLENIKCHFRRRFWLIQDILLPFLSQVFPNFRIWAKVCIESPFFENLLKQLVEKIVFSKEYFSPHFPLFVFLFLVFVYILFSKFFSALLPFCIFSTIHSFLCLYAVENRERKMMS